MGLDLLQRAVIGMNAMWNAVADEEELDVI